LITVSKAVLKASDNASLYYTISRIELCRRDRPFLDEVLDEILEAQWLEET
jgi:hypothetical protein